jgi:LuxR family maltose regulon positive regulatory protein
MHRGDVPATVKHAQQAMDRAADGDDLVRAGAAALSGLASWSDGDLEAAHRSYTDCVERMQRIGHIADILGCSITLADIRFTQGRLGDALATYEHALRIAGDQSTPRGDVLPGTADMYVGMSRVAYERGDLATAIAHLSHSQELGDRAGLPQNPYRWRVAMARVKDAQGDHPGALALLDEALAVYTGDFSADVRPVAAVRARVLAAHGYLDDSLSGAREYGLSSDDDLSYRREYEHVTLARVLLARHTRGNDGNSLRSATDLLQRLLAAAEAGGRTGTAIEILILQALALQADGDTTGGPVALWRALTLAEPEGYVQAFVGEGPAMSVLLTATLRQHGESAYVQRLLGACTDTAQASGASEHPAQAERHVPYLAERLSDRELQILRLLSTDLDGPGIARHLVVSLNTVRTHTHHIYAKLGVNNRRTAVTRARELGILPSTIRP